MPDKMAKSLGTRPVDKISQKKKKKHEDDTAAKRKVRIETVAL